MIKTLHKFSSQTRALLNLALPAAFAFGLYGCATAPNFEGRSAEDLHRELCEGISSTFSQASGSLWVKLQSTNGSGQFPANILVKQNEATIEVTDLLGGVLGVLTVKDGRFNYSGRSAGTQTIQDIIRKQNLFGLSPTDFTGIFFGRLPCMEQVSSMRTSDDFVIFSGISRRGNSAARVSEKFQVKSWGGKNLVKSVELRGLKLEASDFEDPFGLPKTWIISSSAGSCNLRWRDRKVESHGRD